MGLIGMAFGLGFILGPFIGAESLRHLGDTGPGWVAAGLCAANFLLAFFILTESHRPDSAQAAPRPHLDQWAHTLRQPKVGFLVIVFFLTTFCFSCFESTLPLLVGANFHLDFKHDATSASTIGYLFVYCGLIGALVQGGAIGRLVKKMGEPKLIALSLVLTAASFAWLPFLKGASHLSWKVLFHHEGLPWVWLLLALALLSVGTSLTRPPLFGLLSNLTPAHEQGATIGVAQGAGSLARIFGPIFATALLVYSPPLPYLICAAVLLATTFLVVQRLCRDRQPVARRTVPPVWPSEVVQGLFRSLNMFRGGDDLAGAGVARSVWSARSLLPLSTAPGPRKRQQAARTPNAGARFGCGLAAGRSSWCSASRCGGLDARAEDALELAWPRSSKSFGARAWPAARRWPALCHPRRTNNPEPRLTLGRTGRDAPQALARDLNGFGPGAARLDEHSFSFPLTNLAAARGRLLRAGAVRCQHRPALGQCARQPLQRAAENTLDPAHGGDGSSWS